MATRKKARRSVAKRTVNRAPRRRSSVATTRTRRRSRRRMNGAKNDMAAVVMDTVQVGIAAVGSLALITYLGTLKNDADEAYMESPYLRAGAVGAAGIALAVFAPEMRKIGIGVAVGGVVAAGVKALSTTVVPIAINGRARLTTKEYKAIAEKIKRAAVHGQPGTLNAQPATLNYAGYEALS